jgi:hypothetical protein
MKRHLFDRAGRVAAALALLGADACASPEAMVRLQEQLVQAGDAINNLQVNLSVLQGTLDSLVTVVAKQDTTITRLAAAAGVPVVR